jgi:hypothetical protein
MLPNRGRANKQTNKQTNKNQNKKGDTSNEVTKGTFLKRFDTRANSA